MSIEKRLDAIRYHLAQCDPEIVDTVHLKRAVEAVLEILSDLKTNTVVAHEHHYPDNFSEFG